MRLELSRIVDDHVISIFDVTELEQSLGPEGLNCFGKQADGDAFEITSDGEDIVFAEEKFDRMVIHA